MIFQMTKTTNGRLFFMPVFSRSRINTDRMKKTKKMKSEEMMSTVEIQTGNMSAAIDCYYKRLERSEHPTGRFDKAGRWFPEDEEKCDCCFGLRAPSRAYPYSLMTHCRSIYHIANLFSVDTSKMKSHIRSYNKLKKDVSKEA